MMARIWARTVRAGISCRIFRVNTLQRVVLLVLFLGKMVVAMIVGQRVFPF